MFITLGSSTPARINPREITRLESSGETSTTVYLSSGEVVLVDAAIAEVEADVAGALGE